MTPAPAGRPHPTHDVLNQVPPLAGHDVAADQALLAAMARDGAGWVAPELHELGAGAGRPTPEQARLANEHSPVLRTHDRHGHRIDEVDFHPAWHQLMTVGGRHGLHAAPWAQPSRARTSPGRPSSTSGRRPRPGTAARSR